MTSGIWKMFEFSAGVTLQNGLCTLLVASAPLQRDLAWRKQVMYWICRNTLLGLPLTSLWTPEMDMGRGWEIEVRLHITTYFGSRRETLDSTVRDWKENTQDQLQLQHRSSWGQVQCHWSCWITGTCCVNSKLHFPQGCIGPFTAQCSLLLVAWVVSMHAFTWLILLELPVYVYFTFLASGVLNSPQWSTRCVKKMNDFMVAGSYTYTLSWDELRVLWDVMRNLKKTIGRSIELVLCRRKKQKGR